MRASLQSCQAIFELQVFAFTMNSAADFPELGTDDDGDCISEALPTDHAKEGKTCSVPELHQNSNTKAFQGLVKSISRLQISRDSTILNSIQTLGVIYEAISKVMARVEEDRYGDSGSQNFQKFYLGAGRQIRDGEVDSCSGAPEAEGELKCTGVKRSAATVDDLDELLSSLRSLISVLKSHEESQQVWRTKMQALREQKEAFRIEKEHYKQQRKRQRAV